MMLKCIDFITLTRDKPLNKKGWVSDHRNSPTPLVQPSTFRIAEADLVVNINFIAPEANFADDVYIAHTAGYRSFQPQCCINRNLTYLDAKA